MKYKTAWATLLGALALIAHFAVPLVHTDEGTIWRHDWVQREAGMDPVAGASMTVTLVGLVVLAAGLGATWLLRSHAPRLLSAFTALIGAGLTVRSQALWTGRGISSLVNRILGSDGPPPAYTALGGDHFATVWPIAPPLILALVTLAVIWLLKELADDRIDVASARTHLRPALWVFVALLLVPALPWAIDETVDATSTPEAQDMDRFVLSAYDASRLHADSQVLVDATGEEGLSLFDDIAWIHGAALTAFLVSAAMALVGVGGLWRLELEDKYLARTLETTGAAIGLVPPFLLAFAVVLVAVFLYGDTDLTETTPAYAPLLALVPLVLALPFGVATLRRLSADQDRLVADRFPEPIVYD